MYHQLHGQIIMGLMIVVTALALWKGRAPQRFVALAMTVNWLLSGLLLNRSDYFNTQWGLFTVDLLLAVACTWAALRWRGTWLLAQAAFGWLVVMTHVAMTVDTRLHGRAYLAALALWSVAQMLSLLWGVIEAWRERRRLKTAEA